MGKQARLRRERREDRLPVHREHNETVRKRKVAEHNKYVLELEARRKKYEEERAQGLHKPKSSRATTNVLAIASMLGVVGGYRR